MPEQEIKIAKLETRMEQLQKDMTEIKADIKDIKEIFGGLDDQFVKKDDYEKERAVQELPLVAPHFLCRFSINSFHGLGSSQSGGYRPCGEG